MTPEMRTPPLIRTLQAVPRVSAIEGHCMSAVCLQHSGVTVGDIMFYKFSTNLDYDQELMSAHKLLL